MVFKIGARGQGLAIDLFFAVAIFLVVGSSITWIWTNKAAEMEKDLVERELQAMTANTLDTLIRSPGYPEHWEDEDYSGGDLSPVRVIGLAKKDRFLDQDKLNVFVDLSTNYYEETKRKLLIGGNDYYFRVINAEDSLVVAEAGHNPALEAQPKELLQSRVRRPVTYQEENRIAELTLFRKI